jgi:hypothetical protein
MVNGLTHYRPISFDQLKRGSFILSAGIEKFSSRLPSTDTYGAGNQPHVKWVFVAKDLQFSPKNDADGEKFYSVRRLCSELFPNRFTVDLYSSEEMETIFISEDVRPTINWIESCLTEMYLFGFAIDCFLEGWSFEDNEAWQYGLSNLFSETGFNPQIICPGSG